MKLYPLKFDRNYKDYIWGGRNLDMIGKELPRTGKVAESWELSCHKDGTSVISNGEYKGSTLQEYIEKLKSSAVGTALSSKDIDKFPLLIKFIDANDRLSVQVHPDDEYANIHENGELGKNEMWYILKAEPGATLVAGVKRGVTKDLFRQAIENNTVEDCLNYMPVKEGDFIDIPNGLVHAIGKGIILAEVQQNSNTTYRVYDYNRVGADGKTRELHIEKSLDTIDFSYTEDVCKKVEGLKIKINDNAVREVKIVNKYFSIEHYELNGATILENADGSRFYAYIICSGSGKIIYDGGSIDIKMGETIFIPAAMGEYKIEGTLKAVKTYVPDLKNTKSAVKRVYVEKRHELNIEAKGYFNEFKHNLNVSGLTDVRVIHRYDVQHITDEEFSLAVKNVFSEPNIDSVYYEEINIDEKCRYFLIEALPGQYDQRADSAAQCIQLLTQKDKPLVKTAKLVVLNGGITDKEFDEIKKYCINPVEARQATLQKFETLEMEFSSPDKVAVVRGFIDMTNSGITEMQKKDGYAMSAEDLMFCRDYFRDSEKRDPTITELKVIDTYWSDHCRHTTFLTEIDNVEIENGVGMQEVKDVFEKYKSLRGNLYQNKTKSMTLMDIATIAMKEVRNRRKLDDLDESDEINACSIVVPVDVNGTSEDWLVMFKNETHNHPTEIEPFGGAATCLGGAIRDPLSGRAYVYQAMRVTGSGDPTVPVSNTIAGKLPQRKITQTAAAGYSSYGNQVGIPTGQVAEIYHPGFIAKRMEVGAVIAAAPKENVVRLAPEPGDIVILLGGRTGRDGCGGATGSSKEHNEESLTSCGSEVQKGNPPTERKIQRLFRNSEAASLIKRCNDFGAGGVCVAIGELSDSLDINLDEVPKKYEGLDGTELAISESQERMAVVVSKENASKFIALAYEENLEAAKVADITDTGRLRMMWKGRTIVDIKREFLDTNGVKQHINVKVKAPDGTRKVFDGLLNLINNDIENVHDDNSGKNKIGAVWNDVLADLNVCSGKGLSERFGCTIGSGTVLMPFGGKYQLTPQQGMAAKVPVPGGNTNTGTLMAYGYDPMISSWSPFHGSICAVIQALSKITAMGGDYRKVRLTLQEYFEKPGRDPSRWGKPFAALLGAFHVQEILNIPAIGGKDSMSGTFKDFDVPPTLIAFAVNTVNVKNIVSAEFKKPGSKVLFFRLRRNTDELPDFEQLEKGYAAIHSMAKKGYVLSASALGSGGIVETISKMCFGNKIGFKFYDTLTFKSLIKPNYGSIILEVTDDFVPDDLFDFYPLGETIEQEAVLVNEETLSIDDMIKSWTGKLENVFPTTSESHLESSAKNLNNKSMVDISYTAKNIIKRKTPSIARPKVFIPVFPGTNCEYDSADVFEKAGALSKVQVINNLSPYSIEESISDMVKNINSSQIIMIPGGFSAGDEPEGSGKFIAAAFRNPYVKEAVMELLNNRDGLVLGICNGFQALIKLGLVPYGEIRDIDAGSPTLTFNVIGRHIARFVNTKISSNKSPWFSNVKTGDVHTIVIDHGEGRFISPPDIMDDLIKNGQVATQYVDFNGTPTYDQEYNPNGSFNAIEGITSPDGRVLGKMGHSERIGDRVCVNVPGDKDQKLFEAGVNYFR